MPIRISPSKLAFLERCPCFQQEEFTPKSNEAAEEGTMLHAAMETGNDHKLETAEQMEMVAWCRTEQAKLLGQLDAEVAEGPPIQVFTEASLKSERLRGRLDFLAVKRNRALLIDYKFGRADVEAAETNLQGQGYTELVLENHPDVAQVHCAFLCPRTDLKTNDFVFDRATFDNTRVKAIYESVNDPFHQPRANFDVCGMCMHRSRCPAMSKAVVQVGESVLQLPMPRLLGPLEPVTDKDRGIAEALADLMIAWGEAVKTQNKRWAVLTDSAPLGHKLVKRSNGYQVRDAPATVVKLLELNICTVEELLRMLKPSLSKVAESLMDRNAFPGENKKQVVDRLVSMLADLVEEKPPVQYLKADKNRTQLLLGGDAQQKQLQLVSSTEPVEDQPPS